MIKLWFDEAWDDYLAWQAQDKKTLKRINQLIQSIERNGYRCIGKPEPLAHQYAGWWSERIGQQNQIIFRIEGKQLYIASCRGHYNEEA